MKGEKEGSRGRDKKKGKNSQKIEDESTCLGSTRREGGGQ